MSYVAQIVSEIWLVELSSRTDFERVLSLETGNKGFCYISVLSFIFTSCCVFFKSLLNAMLCKNLSSVAHIVLKIWLLEGPKLILNGCCRERPKIKVFVIFQYYLYFLQIAVVYIF